jgi:hypothetical protein
VAGFRGPRAEASLCNLLSLKYLSLPLKPMATLIIEYSEHPAIAGSGACLRCGGAAVAVRRHSFSWHPEWVILFVLPGVLPLFLAIFITTKRKRLIVPLCSNHRNHWIWRRWLTFGGPLLLIAFAVAGYVADRFWPWGRRADLALEVAAGVAVLTLVWVVVVSIAQQTAIRALEVGRTSVTLTNVSEEFIRQYRVSGRDTGNADERIFR